MTNEKSLLIRETDEADREAILALHLAAFGKAEGKEVSALTRGMLEDQTAEPRLSLLAEQSGKVLGHVLFTAVRIQGRVHREAGQILAPLGVAPGAQGLGVGSALVREGLERLRNQGTGLVFVLGHPEYYPRFGFEPAGQHGLFAPYPIPDEVAAAWMVQELNPGFLGRVKGSVQCAEVLDRPEHWRE